MKSHEILFRPADLARALLPTVLVVIFLAVLLRLGNRLNLLPRPAVGATPDLTVLRHQALASRARDPASILLVGDSTCLAGVEASRLSQELPGRPRVLNLALIIGLSLEVYGEMVSNFTAANPGQVRAVVLLVTPGKFTGSPLSQGWLKIWREVVDSAPEPSENLFGTGLLRRRLLSHALDVPLHGEGAAFYGFSSGLDVYMSEHNGSLADFGRFEPPRRKARTPFKDYVSPQMQGRSRDFRAKIPPGVKLIIGLTPGPASVVSADAAEGRARLLREWNRWINADVILTNLPAALSDTLFSPTSHLNQQGQRVFTSLLEKELASVLGNAENRAAENPAR